MKSHDLLISKRTIRAFRNRPIARGLLWRFVNAGRLAPQLFFLFILLIMPIVGHAGDNTPARAERKGFMVGFGAGGGGSHLRSNDDRGLFISDFKVGGGVSEKIILMYESTINRMNGDVVVYSYFSSQFFLVDNFYLRPGIGLSAGTVNEEAFLIDIGFGAGMAAGYEWRLLKRFALSPEARFDYIRLGNGYNYYSYGILADIRWYF